MKDKVIRFKNNLQYYVLDETVYNGQKYIFCVEVDNDNAQVKNNYIVLEVKSDNGKTTVHTIDDPTIARLVLNFFSQQIKTI